MAHLFFAGKMLSQDADSQVTNAVLESAVKNGSLVVLGNLAADTTYVASGDVEYDVYEAAAPVAATDEVAIIDLATIDGGVIGDNYYRLGIKLYNLEAQAGEVVRARRLHLHDKFWLGASNFASAPTVGQFATATAGSMLHTPAAQLPQSGYAIKIQKKQDLTAGMESITGGMYLCEVVQL